MAAGEVVPFSASEDTTDEAVVVLEEFLVFELIAFV